MAVGDLAANIQLELERLGLDTFGKHTESREA